MSSSIHSALVTSSNFVGDGTAKVFSTLYNTFAGEVGAYSLLGAISGKFLSQEGSIGLFQGFVQGVFFVHVMRPLGQFLSQERENSPKLSSNGELFLKVVSCITHIAVPVLITSRIGKNMMTLISLNLPLRVRPYLMPDDRNYNMFRGLLATIVPLILVVALSALINIAYGK